MSAVDLDWLDAVHDAVHDAAELHGLDPDELLDVEFNDEGMPIGDGIDFVLRLDSLADADPTDETFVQAVADEVASYAADLQADPIAAKRSTLDPAIRDRMLLMAGIQTRAAGKDVTPGHDQLHRYWTRGKGLARWKTWTELRNQLLKHVPQEKADRFASAWFHERYGFWPGDDKNRIMHGKSPRGHRVGPG